MYSVVALADQKNTIKIKKKKVENEQYSAVLILSTKKYHIYNRHSIAYKTEVQSAIDCNSS